MRAGEQVKLNSDRNLKSVAFSFSLTRWIVLLNYGVHRSSIIESSQLFSITDSRRECYGSKDKEKAIAAKPSLGL
jgi:hypothetical protein